MDGFVEKSWVIVIFLSWQAKDVWPDFSIKTSETCQSAQLWHKILEEA